MVVDVISFLVQSDVSFGKFQNFQFFNFHNSNLLFVPGLLNFSYHQAAKPLAVHTNMSFIDFLSCDLVNLCDVRLVDIVFSGQSVIVCL